MRRLDFQKNRFVGKVKRVLENNVLISHYGALGDNGYMVPGLNALRTKYDNIYLSCKPQGLTALDESGLIDGFIIKPNEFSDWDQNRQVHWLLNTAREQNISFETYIPMKNLVPGVYMFHHGDPNFDMPKDWKIENAAGVSFFDAFSLKMNCPEAFGMRPITHHTETEQSWLDNFRFAYGIPQGVFLLMWQFAGSARHKWYPYFKEVIQQGIMRKYENVYVIALGDLEDKMKWDGKYHNGRYINLSGISFRKAYIQTSIADLFVSPETGVYVFSQAYKHVPKILLATHTSGRHITCGDETKIMVGSCRCAPCYNIVFGVPNECEQTNNSPVCIATIFPEMLIEKIEEVIANWRKL